MDQYAEQTKQAIQIKCPGNGSFEWYIHMMCKQFIEVK